MCVCRLTVNFTVLWAVLLLAAPNSLALCWGLGHVQVHHRGRLAVVHQDHDARGPGGHQRRVGQDDGTVSLLCRVPQVAAVTPTAFTSSFPAGFYVPGCVFGPLLILSFTVLHTFVWLPSASCASLGLLLSIGIFISGF